MKMYLLQSRFLMTIAKLIFYAHESGYDVTLGRGFVTPAENKADGGIDGSLHTMGWRRISTSSRMANTSPRQMILQSSANGGKRRGQISRGAGDSRRQTAIISALPTEGKNES
jgi:hypothetical protein